MFFVNIFNKINILIVFIHQLGLKLDCYSKHTRVILFDIVFQHI